MLHKKNARRTYLTVSDVIAKLTELRTDYGDLPIRVLLAGMKSKPIISGIRYNAAKNGRQRNIDIVPKYDVRGIINEMSGANSLVKQIADVQLLFVQYAKTMMQAKATLDEIKNHGGNISAVRKPFTQLYDIAKAIRDGVNSLQGFDKRLLDVAKETIRDSDYAATFAHHVDESMTDAGFAALVTEGVGEKTSVQRLAVYVDIIKKINEEIVNRKRRISALKKRIKADGESQESCNAKILINKTNGILDTLMKRRDYVADRFEALRKSINATVSQYSNTISSLFAEHPTTCVKKGNKI